MSSRQKARIHGVVLGLLFQQGDPILLDASYISNVNLTWKLRSFVSTRPGPVDVCRFQPIVQYQPRRQHTWNQQTSDPGTRLVPRLAGPRGKQSEEEKCVDFFFFGL